MFDELTKYNEPANSPYTDYLRSSQSTFWQNMGAHFMESWTDMSLTALLRIRELDNKDMSPEDMRDYLSDDLYTPSDEYISDYAKENPIMNYSDWYDHFANKYDKKWLDRSGIVHTDGHTKEYWIEVFDRKDKELTNRGIIERRDAGVFEKVLSFGAGMAAQIPDPLNYIPILGKAKWLNMAKNPGFKRAIRGGIEGGVGNLLVEPVVIAAAKQDQRDYTMLDSLINIAFGIGIGGGMHMAGGKLKDFINNKRLHTDVKRDAVDSMLKGEEPNSEAILSDMKDIPVSEIKDLTGYQSPAVKSWKEDFNNAVSHTNMKTMQEHPSFTKAKKEGNIDEAVKLVDDLISGDKTIELAKTHPDAIIIPVISRAMEVKNKIPVAFATRLSELSGLDINTNIKQANKVSHTKKGAMKRLIDRAEFTGEVIKGQRYILVDDALTAGGTINQLRHFIENKGGKVVAISSLSYSKFSTIVKPPSRAITNLKKKFGTNKLSKLLYKYNIVGSLDALTDAEVKYLNKFKSIESLENKIKQEGGRPVNLSERQAYIESIEKEPVSKVRRPPILTKKKLYTMESMEIDAPKKSSEFNVDEQTKLYEESKTQLELYREQGLVSEKEFVEMDNVIKKYQSKVQREINVNNAILNCLK